MDAVTLVMLELATLVLLSAATGILVYLTHKKRKAKQALIDQSVPT